jgi:signal transduction histidine kinase
VKFLQAAYDSNERELHTIEDLLSKARIEAGNIKAYKSKVYVKELIDSVIDESSVKYAARDQKLTFRFPKQHEIVVNADEHLIRMVLENLIDNASKYSADNKTVAVRLYITGNCAVIDIHDQGFGISKEDQVRLFQKFARIDTPDTSAISGTGLGLYWAKQIVELHGGSIQLKSSSKAGSTFSFTLPL